MRFQCPICGSPSYQRVVIERRKGKRYETQFFECLGCSVMFREPELFTLSPALREEIERTPKSTMAWATSHNYQRLVHRYARVSAKRRNGGTEPTAEQVTALLRQQQ